MTPNAPAWVPKDAESYTSHVCEGVSKKRRTAECEGYASGGDRVGNGTGTVLGIQHPISHRIDIGRIQG